MLMSRRRWRRLAVGAGASVVLLAAANAQAREASGASATPGLVALRDVAAAIPVDPGWTVRQVPDPNGSPNPIDIYRGAEVRADLLRVKANLEEATGDNPVLRAYLSTALPSGAGLAGGGPVRRSEADRAWTQVLGVARALRGLSSLTVDLKVISLPHEGAVATLRAAGLADEVRQTRTTGTLSSVWRGLYLYEVAMDGVVRWEGSLDLVQERGSRLVCAAPSADPQVRLPCRLEAQ